MGKTVKWTESAWSDLEEIANFIARDSTHYASAFVLKIRSIAESLESLSERGRIVPELNDASIREVISGRYRIMYSIAENTVTILGIIHGARDLASFWEEENRFS